MLRRLFRPMSIISASTLVFSLALLITFRPQAQAADILYMIGIDDINHGADISVVV